ncbi:MAG: hypothetical protein RIR70_235, partial [Pseudomonadota bacterium]
MDVSPPRSPHRLAPIGQHAPQPAAEADNPQATELAVQVELPQEAPPAPRMHEGALMRHRLLSQARPIARLHALTLAGAASAASGLFSIVDANNRIQANFHEESATSTSSRDDVVRVGLGGVAVGLGLYVVGMANLAIFRRVRASLAAPPAPQNENISPAPSIREAA